MRQGLILIYLSLMSLFLQAQENLNVMTFNIRYNNPGDSMNAWPFRKNHAASQILFHQAHTVGIQEALHGQVMDLRQLLPGYGFTGHGRTDGKEKGEYSGIFYDSSRLKLLKTADFWLAEETETPGKKGWDAAIERMVTWAQFRDKRTRQTFFHFNTHFDHIGKIARRESAKLLIRKVKEIAGKTPVIVTGDFNATPDDEPIQVITVSGGDEILIDAKNISSMPHYGPGGTFNGFKPKETGDQPIDYIFIKNGVRVLQHATLSQTWQGRFSSDHFPVFAVVKIGK